MTDREWAKLQHPGLVESNQIVDLEPEVDLEFKTVTVKLQEIPDASGRALMIDWSPAQQVEQALNDGWQIDDKIICPPFVMIIFSREKEEKETTDNE